MDNDNYEDVSLELGAIIKLVSETNIIFHNKYFLIDYLDNEKIIVVGKNKKTLKLTIKDGAIEDTSITQIIVVDRPQYKGFAKQNGMEMGTWWSIHFSFEGGEIIKGKIVGIEKDQIEFESPQYPDSPLIIDFQYKGIPQDLNILSIRKWNKEDEEDEEELGADEHKQGEDPDYDDDLDGIIDSLDDELIPDQIFDSKEIEDTIKDDLIMADKIKIIKTDVVVTEIKQRKEQDRIFDIEYQVDDLLDSLLSKIDENLRTPLIENKIHTTIDRYLQLRKDFSKFNREDYIEGPLFKTKEYRPLLENLYKFKNKLNWIIPIVKNRIELVDITNVADANDDVNPTTSDIDIGGTIEFQNKKNDNIPEGINKYLHIYGRKNTHLHLPVEFNKEDLIIEDNIQDNLFTLVENNLNFGSSAIKQITNFEICIDDNQKLPSDAAARCTDVRFQTQVYNKNMMVPFYEKKEGKNAIFKELISADKIALKGFVFLPSLVNYSRLLLQNTNIYNKSLLSFNHARLFKIFQTMRENQKFLGKKYVFDKNNKKSFQEKFLKKNSQYLFNDDQEWSDKSTENNRDNYKEFLENIIPNSRDIIKNMYDDLSNNKIRVTSYQKLIDELEPYLIYNNDIVFYQYIALQECLNHSMR
ncbi:MAG: hypothetical protein H8E55_04450, partial [Pelagibacterales bacterium]|nr:hypothetical protein [Pelagibacterales bacterium]